MRKCTLMILPMLLAASLLGGCYRHNVIVGGASFPEPVFEDKFHTHLFWGLANIEGTDIAASTLCPTGVSHVETKVSFVNGLLSALTGGIYTPTQVRIYCTQQ